MRMRMGDYLVESSLGVLLEQHFSCPFVHNRKVPGSDIRNRPDYRNDDLMLIVEFDGYRHFTCAKTIVADKMKDRTYKAMGYTVVRVPYFVQASSAAFKHYFDIDVNIEQVYPHGFIDPKATLPSDFNSLGVASYLGIMDTLPEEIAEDISSSLVRKGIELGSSLMVTF